MQHSGEKTRPANTAPGIPAIKAEPPADTEGEAPDLDGHAAQPPHAVDGEALAMSQKSRAEGLAF